MKSYLAFFPLLLLACRGTKEVRKEAKPDSGAAGPPVVHIDPSLLTNGGVVTAAAVKRPLSGDIRIPAEVVPSESAAAEVGALVSGRLASIDVRDGERVKRGQQIATVDSPEAARAVADLIRSRARAIAGQRKLDRQLLLEQDRATSPAAIDEARTELAVAEADAAAARTMLVSLGIPEPPAPEKGVLAARVPIRSPIEGVLVSRLVELGAAVGPEKTLFRVIATDRVIVEARWTEETIAPPAPGFAVKLLARGTDGGAGCAAHVLSTIALVDDKTRARRLRLEPEGACPMLVAGAYLDASLTSFGAPAALAVPRAAVVDVRGAPTVFVTHGDRTSFSPRLVKTGRTTTDDVTIESGLAEGDVVAVVGAVLLKGELLRAELESP